MDPALLHWAVAHQLVSKQRLKPSASKAQCCFKTSTSSMKWLILIASASQSESFTPKEQELSATLKSLTTLPNIRVQRSSKKSASVRWVLARLISQSWLIKISNSILLLAHGCALLDCWYVFVIILINMFTLDKYFLLSYKYFLSHKAVKVARLTQLAIHADLPWNSTPMKVFGILWVTTLRSSSFAIQFSSRASSTLRRGKKTLLDTCWTLTHKFPHRNPQTHLKDPNMFWDFISLRPETTHQVMFLFGDRGTPDGYRHMNG